MRLALPLLLAAACGGSPAPVELPDMATALPDMTPPPDLGPPPRTHVIVVVWDGLRADPIDANVPPTLAEVASAGATFTDHHATWPPLSMTNAASLATGAPPAANGGPANRIYAP